ncbi:MAG: hypothetical protein GF401_18905 [Chitinivibrionales bacterium]|nr:hypothetical protein [Chitinivibrionales bacterium]
MNHIPLKSLFPFCMILVILAGFSDVFAKEFDLETFSEISVMDNNRVKPLDTYARIKLLQFSGRSSIEGYSAIEWLARVLFTPAKAAQDQIFLIDNPEIADAIGAERHRRRYSFSDLHAGFGKLHQLARKASMTPGKERSNFENEAARAYRNVTEYAELTGMFSFIEPDPAYGIKDSAVARILGLDTLKPAQSYYEMLAHSPALSRAMKEVSGKKRSEWSSLDSAVVSVAHSMYRMGARIGNPPLHIIPVGHQGSVEWLSPWGYLAKYASSSLGNNHIDLLIELRENYRSDNPVAFEKAVEQFRTSVQKDAGKVIDYPDHSLEISYNALNPFLKSKILYGLTCILALFLMIIYRTWLHFTAVALIIPGFLFQTWGLIARMIILNRPPIDNLYGTLVFVAWASVILGAVVELWQRNAMGLLISSFIGFALLHLAGKYGADGDTMGMLSAVLNNNFWLTTHIITITLGYTGLLAAGIAGHVYIIRKLASGDKQKLTSTNKTIYAVLAFGFTFTVIGTVLGGMWADQSWGRFWGWDPKENGALLICLWCTIIFHARAGGMIRGWGLAMGSIVGLVLVMFAWLGVNLLGVGLHSYGFTSTGAQVLFGTVGFEALFLIGTSVAIKTTRR